MLRHRWRICYLDEHYIPSLLAFHGLDDETDCRGGLVTANWTLPGAKHPLEYQPRQVKPALCAPPPCPFRGPSFDRPHTAIPL